MNNLIISNTMVHQDALKRYRLNDIHKVSGGKQKDRPKYFLENLQTKELIGELKQEGGIPPTSVIRGVGTYSVKELVYAYAMWISPAFSLKVIRAYDALANNQLELTPKINQYISMPPTDKSDYYTALSRLASIKSWAQKNYNNTMVDDIEAIEKSVSSAFAAMSESLLVISQVDTYLGRWRNK